MRLGVLRGLSGKERATAAQLRAASQASLPTLRRHLGALIAIGLIEELPGESDGETVGRPAAQFRINPDLRASVESTFRFSR